MKIDIHADEVAKNLIEETHDVHITFLSTYFKEVTRQYKGGYKSYCKEMYIGLDSDALLVMQNILDCQNGEG